VSGINSLGVAPRKFLGFPPVVYPAERGEESTVKVIANQARGRFALAISLLFLIALGACAPHNNAPVITDLTAAPSVIGQAETTVIECVASDPDGDGLSYQWLAEQGSTSGQGPTISWTAPNACGDYIVTVTVTDSKGAKTSQSVTIKVKEAG
jgi:hypothetical protein